MAIPDPFVLKITCFVVKFNKTTLLSVVSSQWWGKFGSLVKNYARLQQLSIFQIDLDESDGSRTRGYNKSLGRLSKKVVYSNDMCKKYFTVHVTFSTIVVLMEEYLFLIQFVIWLRFLLYTNYVV